MAGPWKIFQQIGWAIARDKKRSSVAAALPGRYLKCSIFPGRKKGKEEKEMQGKREKRKRKKHGGVLG